jgi:hypothetical protein
MTSLLSEKIKNHLATLMHSKKESGRKGDRDEKVRIYFLHISFDVPSVLSQPWLHHPATISPPVLSDTLQKTPILEPKNRGLVFEVFSSADRPPALLRTRVFASPGRPGFAFIGKCFFVS